MEHIKPQVTQFTPEPIHEEQDVNVKAILAFGIFLFIMALVIHVAMWVMYRGLDRWAESRDAAPASATVMQEQKAGAGRIGDVQSAQGAEDVQEKFHEIVRTFPEPRLQPDAARDTALFRQSQERALHSYAKVDASGNTVRIPIDRAMDIIVERGLPKFGEGGGRPSPGQVLAPPGKSSGTIPAAADRTTRPR